MKFFVTGAAGFIGSNLVDRLLSEGHTVVGFDNFSTGREDFLKSALRQPRFSLKRVDLFEAADVTKAFSEGADMVFHLAANADVKDGLKQPRKDLEQNTIVTWNVLEAMRAHGIRDIGFSSTGSVYGEAAKIPTPEDCPFPIQTSLYGASKLACEALISSYAEGYGMRGTVYRFVSILGPRYTHGHVVDFFRQLKKNPDELFVLGNGKQRKSYLHVTDCVDAITGTMMESDKKKFQIYNLGTDEFVTVDDSIAVICSAMGVKPKIVYGGGDRGWVGDNPFIFLDCAKVRAQGWRPKNSIVDSVRKTVAYLEDVGIEKC